VIFLRSTARKKNGKEHRYWSLVENRRLAKGKVVQRHVLYLGEINDSQREAWRKTIEIFEEGQTRARQVALFPEERIGPIEDQSVVRIRLSELRLHRPRQWGACWLAGQLYRQLELDRFWAERLAPSRKGTRWDLVLQTLVIYRLIDPGSEWRLYRQWYEGSAMADLLGADLSLADIHKLYECHDRLLAHKTALFDHLSARWKDLFNARFEVLLYDLTSTYFESDPPFPEGDKRRYGYSRDKRPDCVQVVIALIVTPEGFPLAYEVMAGNTSDKTTLRGFLQKIEQQYGKAQRIWVMDRGIPTEEVLAQMRVSDPPIYYLVGTSKGRLTQYEAALLGLAWQEVRPGVEVKLLPQAGELYVLAQSEDRVNKERAMRRRQLKRLWKRLHELAGQRLKRDRLLMKLGAAKAQAPRVWRLVQIQMVRGSARLEFRLRKDRLREMRRREGRYLLRTNLCDQEPARLWEFYVQLTLIESAFKDLKDDLSLRPIFHQLEHRIEAHIFIAFLSYCLHVSLRNRLRPLAPGLTSRTVLDKFAAVQMIDVHLPTTDGREVILSRYTQPEQEVMMLVQGLKLALPKQSTPRIRQLKGQQM
jgi:transposase